MLKPPQCLQVNPEQWLSNEKAQMSLLVPSWVPSKMPLTQVAPASAEAEEEEDEDTPTFVETSAAGAFFQAPEVSPFEKSLCNSLGKPVMTSPQHRPASHWVRYWYIACATKETAYAL